MTKVILKSNEFEGPGGRLRDDIARIVCNWILNHIATPWYRDRIHALMLIGIGVVTRPKNSEE